MLKDITGIEEIDIYGEGLNMYAIVEEIEFVPDVVPVDIFNDEEIWAVSL